LCVGAIPAEQVNLLQTKDLGVECNARLLQKSASNYIDSGKAIERKKSAITRKSLTPAVMNWRTIRKYSALKYGQFMGEEAESGNCEQAIPHDDDKVEDVVKQFWARA